MAQAPLLKAKRVRLEPFGTPHLGEHYVGWLNDPEVVRFSEQRHLKHSLESCRAYVAGFARSPHYLWAIVTAGPQAKHVGNISAHVDVHNAVADVGILLGDRQVWGQGYGTEAWQRVCEFLLREAGMRKVTAGTMAVNKGMLGIMRHVHMRIEAKRPRQFLFEGREVDSVMAGLFREDLPRSARRRR